MRYLVLQVEIIHGLAELVHCLYHIGLYLRRAHDKVGEKTGHACSTKGSHSLFVELQFLVVEARAVNYLHLNTARGDPSVVVACF